MIPINDDHSVRVVVRQVAGQVGPQAGPEEGRDPPAGREVVLVDVVQHQVVQGQQVLQLRLRQSSLHRTEI